MEIKRLLSNLNGNGKYLSPSEKLLIRLLQWKEKCSIANNSFSALLKLLETEMDPENLSTGKSKYSLYAAEKALCKLVPLKPVHYDCCPKGHMCFTGKYADLDACPICNEKRLLESQKSQMQFQYWSPLQQIRMEMLSPD